MKTLIPLFLFLFMGNLTYSQVYQIPNVTTSHKIGDNLSGFPNDSIADNDQFGYSIARIGDIDGDGNEDIAVGVPYDDEGGADAGSVVICFMDNDNAVSSIQKISNSQGSFDGTINAGDLFGSSVAGIGDINNDGVPDIAVGVPNLTDDGSATGGVWIIRLQSNGRAKSGSVLISDTDLTANLAASDNFGTSVAGIGDVDKDGVEDIAVGVPGRDFTFRANAGSAFIIFLDTAGAYVSEHQIYLGLSVMTANDNFGYSMSVYPDCDNDTINELVVGAPYDDDGGTDYGAVYLLRLDDDGSVKSYEKYNSPIFGDKEYHIQPAGSVLFGRSVASFDINQDDIYDLIVGAPSDNAFYAILLNDTLEDVQWRKFGSDFAWDIIFSGINFGFSCTGISDNDGDGNIEILVGAPLADDGGTNRGVVYVLEMDSLKYETYHGNINKYHKISDISGGFTGTLDNSDAWGTDIESLGDLDGDGNEDIAVSTTFDDDGGTNRGAVYILFLDSTGVVLSHVKINDDSLGTGSLSNDCRFGTTITNMGDLDGDDVIDIAVGTIQDDDGGGSSSANRGAVWVLFLNSNGTVKSKQKISDTQGNFYGTLSDGDLFGTTANIGDLDNDGVNDMAVGCRRDDDNSLTNSGSVWILFMNSNGTVKDTTKLGPLNGGISAYVTFAANNEFGAVVEGMGDMDGDGNEDIAVTAVGEDGTGAVHIIYLDDDGTALGAQKINNAANNFPETIESSSIFGCQLARLGDIDGNGHTDLLIGNQNHIGIGTSQRGCAWVAYLNDTAGVMEAKIIDDYKSDFYGLIENGDVLGNTVAVMQTDINNDGAVDIFLGARNEDDGGSGRGAIYFVSFFPHIGRGNYVELEHELDNEYYKAVDESIWIMYDEEYDVGSSYLEYKIYNESRTLVGYTDASGFTTISGSPAVPVEYGQNYLQMDLNNLSLSNGYYILEVTGRKNDKYYLRFKI